MYASIDLVSHRLARHLRYRAAYHFSPTLSGFGLSLPVASSLSLMSPCVCCACLSSTLIYLPVFSLYPASGVSRTASWPCARTPSSPRPPLRTSSRPWLHSKPPRCVTQTRFFFTNKTKHLFLSLPRAPSDWRRGFSSFIAGKLSYTDSDVSCCVWSGRGLRGPCQGCGPAPRQDQELRHAAHDGT